MTRRRRHFSPEFKEEAVRMVLEGERTVAAVAPGVRDQRQHPRQFGESASDRARPGRAAGLRAGPGACSRAQPAVRHRWRLRTCRRNRRPYDQRPRMSTT
ncbi:transposase [Nonomuraea sediminis]|uniref:transposase n=1 Tax=Nonomuraea sediminis TaxID=2835864 RepID=UPI001BDD8C91